MTLQEFLPLLRTANDTRQGEWPGSASADTLFRAAEVVGEVGELADAVALLELGPGSIRQITEETGDALIALDLFCAHIGIDTQQQPTPASYTKLNHLPIAACLLMEAVKKLARAERGIAGNSNHDPMDQVRACCGDILYCLSDFCRARQINLIGAATAKFNATSVKHGLQTRL
ncbi:MazG-like family protein [Thalassovita sp.]|uniref:MazG-like family protein n=1 Tax=Thalassovita sp. TaxID=1979401 RepID=UPI002AAFFC9A|nr:MazG-like family protein [Thalassovita sp.]